MVTIYKPKDGFIWNPLTKYGPNRVCFCGSDKKFKKCCRDKVPPTIKPEELKQVERVLETGAAPKSEDYKYNTFGDE